MVNLDKSYKSCSYVHCGYEFNEKNDTVCRVCGKKLVATSDKTSILSKPTSSKREKKISLSQKSLSASIEQNFRRCERALSKQLNKRELNKSLRELQKPSNLLGLFGVALGLMLWANYIFVIGPNQKIAKSTAVKLAVKPTHPRGIFSYGGAPIFAPLVASGINGLIEQKYPGYELRYTKPLDGDYSTYKGIRMLVNGELSFAYNERPLTDKEFETAKLRDVNLKQIPVALDGVIVYGNRQLSTDRLNKEQLREIFMGQIDNWQDIDPRADDLPIIPIVIKNEDLQILGIGNNAKLARPTEYTSNYTQALRKVIATPGAISFASAAIAGNQQLIKPFLLADGTNSSQSDYIDPLLDNGQINIKDFKSGKYPLTRRVYLVYRRDESFDHAAAKVYTNYLTSAKGQSIIKQVGLVPIVGHEQS